jgi:hypothetical protein
MKKWGLERAFAVAACALILAVALPAGAEESLRSRLARLETHLRVIEEEARTGRLVSGSFLVAGGAIGGGIFITLTAASPLTPDWLRPPTGPILGAGATVAMIAPGAYLLASVSDAERLPKRFYGLPDLTENEALAKLAAGEAMLASIAAQSRAVRLGAASTMLCLGLLGLAAGGGLDAIAPALSSRIGLANYEPLDEAALVGGISMLASAAVGFAIEGRAERERIQYIEGSRQAFASRPRPSVALGPEGIAFGLTIGF